MKLGFRKKMENTYSKSPCSQFTLSNALCLWKGWDSIFKYVVICDIFRKISRIPVVSVLNAVLWSMEEGELTYEWEN